MGLFYPISYQFKYATSVKMFRGHLHYGQEPLDLDKLDRYIDLNLNIVLNLVVGQGRLQCIENHTRREAQVLMTGILHHHNLFFRTL